MKPELLGQLRTGTPLSERECYGMYLEANANAVNALRGLAAARKDARWLMAVRIHEQIMDNVKKLINKGGSRVIWLPGHEN